MTDTNLKVSTKMTLAICSLKLKSPLTLRLAITGLMHICNFGELCDHIANKIQLDNSDNCTSQQAFYKLRDTISSTLQIDKKTISTDLSLPDLLPRESRRSRTKKLEQQLGFKIHILRPPRWFTRTL